MGMKATKFASNSSEVLATIPVDDMALTKSKELRSTDVSTDIVSKMTKVIGKS